MAIRTDLGSTTVHGSCLSGCQVPQGMSLQRRLPHTAGGVIEAPPAAYATACDFRAICAASSPAAGCCGSSAACRATPQSSSRCAWCCAPTTAPACRVRGGCSSLVACRGIWCCALTTDSACWVNQNSAAFCRAAGPDEGSARPTALLSACSVLAAVDNNMRWLALPRLA